MFKKWEVPPVCKKVNEIPFLKKKKVIIKKIKISKSRKTSTPFFYFLFQAKHLNDNCMAACLSFSFRTV